MDKGNSDVSPHILIEVRHNPGDVVHVIENPDISEHQITEDFLETNGISIVGGRKVLNSGELER